MKITNQHNLPEGMVRALSEESHLNPERMSVTDLIGPPLIRTLKIEKADQITVDVSDNLWALLGNAVHYVIARGHKEIETLVDKCVDGIQQDNIKFGLIKGGVDIEHKKGFTEWKVEYDYNYDPHFHCAPIIIVGKIDHYSKEGIIEDYKITSVWSFLNGLKAEWEAQLNCYDWLCQKTGLGRAKGLRINAILRDWQVSKTVEKDYPRIPFMTIPAVQWDFAIQDEYISSRLQDHRNNSHRECTGLEKWQRESTFAVMKEGRKSALRVLENQLEAEKWCDKNEINCQTVSIVERKGGCIRCLSYCNVRSVCPYVKGE